MSARALVLLHGIWMPGAEMIWLKRRLERDGKFNCYVYSYPSVRASLQQNADLFYDFVQGLGATAVDLVGHSLGGIVALRMLATHDDVPGGRVVCLGSPLCGSQAAASVLRNRWGRAIIGNTLSVGVVAEPASQWAGSVTAEREIGVIAGTVPVGMGRIVTHFDSDNDGTVSVDETRLPGVTDHLCLPVNHTGLVTSAEVAGETRAFLERGKFARAS